MNAFVVFDVSDKLAEVKAGLKQKGYWSSWIAKSGTYYLPANSMWKPDCDLQQAKKDVEDVVRRVTGNGSMISLQRCIVLSVNPWEGIVGMP
ncbi:MAG: hypothetical protein ACOYVG_07270 [Bacteroidota bacterium]|jgi:hypothetical protein